MARANTSSNNKQRPIAMPELVVNQPADIDKEKCYNSNATQSSVDDEQIEDDIEIIPNSVLQDDFVQLDLQEYNEQSNIVCEKPISLLLNMNFI